MVFMKVKKLKQELIIKTTSYDLYEAFMDAKKHALFTGASAVISRAINGSFISYNEEIFGVNIDLIQDRKILQNWRMKDWPEGHHAMLLIGIKEVKGGIKLSIVQKGIPSEHYEKVMQTWNEFLGKLKSFLEEKKI